ATAKLGIATPDDLAGRMGELAAIGPSVSALTAGTVPGEGHAARQASGPAIRLLGPCEVVVGGAVVDCPAGLLGQALKRVALAGRLPIEELMEELWPGAAPGAGRQRLRTLLTRLRQVVGPLLMRDGDWIRLAPEVEVDTLRFEELAGAAEAAAAARDPQAGELAGRALKLYRGELLPTDRHLDFTSGRRERLRRRYLSMVTIAVDHVAPGQVDRAVRLLEAAITEDPHEETLYIRAAALLATADRAGEAASFLRRARAALAELGVEPSSEAVELDRSLTRR
ncbi:MAG TPA: bacterial transcriptional activator domain-containing protein, partial [Acidimicrobiales bacterium]|nr:bacterial transcriptional activator domain-containing protein [Acidimicrobiales bacterium]